MAFLEQHIVIRNMMVCVLITYMLWVDELVVSSVKAVFTVFKLYLKACLLPINAYTEQHGGEVSL